MREPSQPAVVTLRPIEGFPAWHGFTLRSGGVSKDPFATLNLGDAVGDAPFRVRTNRRRVCEALGIPPGRLRLLRQVHGDRIVDWSSEAADDELWGIHEQPWKRERPERAEWPEAAALPDRGEPLAGSTPPEGDAHMSADPRDVLAISVADCLPILYVDPVTGAAAAAHCGWRGTGARLAAKVVEAMTSRFGSRPEDLWVGCGPAIGGGCYQVGSEVVEACLAAGADADAVIPDREGRYRLDLRAANRAILTTAGVDPARIAASQVCTHCDPSQYFSYRREGSTGRHWAVVRPGPAGSMGNGAPPRDHAAPAGA